MMRIYIQPKKEVELKNLKKEVDNLGFKVQKTDKDNKYKMDSNKFPIYVTIPETITPTEFFKYQGKLLRLKSIKNIELKSWKMFKNLY